MKTRRIAAMAFATLSAALMVTSVGVGAANASSSLTGTYGGVNRITVSYATSSNVLSVKDVREDGYGGRSFWSTSAGYSGVKDNSNGYNTTTTTTIPGSGTLSYNACVKDGSTNIACTGYTSDTV